MGLQHLPKLSDRVAELLETGASIHPCFLASNLRSSTLMFAGTMDRITHPDQSLALSVKDVLESGRQHAEMDLEVEK